MSRMMLMGAGGPLAAPSASLPSDVSGLQLWLRSGYGYWQDTSGTTPAGSGDPVGRWDDQSGNGRNVTQATSGFRPLVEASAVNSLPSVKFDGADDYLNLPNFLTAYTSGEVYAVVKADADPPTLSSQTGLWWFGSTNSTHYTWTDGKIYEDFGTNGRHNTGDPTLSLASWRLYNVYSASNDWQSYIDGTSHFTNGTNGVQWTSTPRIGVSQETSYRFKGQIAELFFYNKKLSGPERAIVKSYITSTFGLTIA